MREKAQERSTRMRKACSAVFGIHKSKVDKGVVGLQGFEPWTSPTRTERSTKLSHSPNVPAVRGVRRGYPAMFVAGCKQKGVQRSLVFLRAKGVG